MNPKPVTVQHFIDEQSEPLKLQRLVSEEGMDRLIREPTVNRPGLLLAGFKKYFAPKRVQVIGNVETAYLRSLDPAMRKGRYTELLRCKIPCVIFCRNLRPEVGFLEAAGMAGVPVFQTHLITMKFISAATLALEGMFAPRGQIHASMVDIQGVGVIIQGESGIGKSEAVLGLIERGHSLVADDALVLRLEDGDELVGSAKDEGRNMMEVRGIGIVNVAATFGVGAVRREKRVDLVVELKRWEDSENVERVGLDQKFTEVLGQSVPFMSIPVRPGRDLARLIEVAAFQAKLLLSGYNPAEEFIRRLSDKMQKGLQL